MQLVPMTLPASRTLLILAALLPVTAFSQNPAEPTPKPRDPADSSPGANFDNRLPGIDPSGGLLRFNGQTWAVENNNIYIVTGPVLKGELTSIGIDKVSVPKYYYKVMFLYHKHC